MCPREPKQEFVAVKSSECKRRHRSSCYSKGGTNDDGDTALHDAVRAPAYGGPGRRTALHAAVISNNEGGTKILLDWKKDLANELDVHGWTPLHYAAQFGHVLIKEELEAAGATLGLRNVMSKDNEFLANEKKERAEFKKSIPIDIKKAGDTHLIVATLIATVTFAAGFTMLGGYNSNDTQPKLRHGDSNKRSSFQSFCYNRFHGHDIIHLCCFDLSCFG
ncbi:hypothetical protein LOK49_Contig51G00010 [Camellia lanceoleosa]|nr:hypothetical protein LOK49_Contig51G00010 [Camellia lanceoleosa]